MTRPLRLSAYFELQDPGNSRWLAMEGLRGLAVLLVFVVHYTSLMADHGGAPGAHRWWMTALHEMGNTGVDLFFVLSGFLIYRAVIARPIDHRTYAARRVERIYPVFLAVLALYLVLSLAMPGSSKIPADPLAAAGYIAANALLLPGILPIEPIITVAWSLSYEAFYYVLIPVMAAALGMRGWSPGQRLALFLGIVAAASAAHLVVAVPLYRLVMFVGGIALYEIAVGMRVTARASLWADVLALAGAAVAIACFTLLGHSRWMIDETPLGALPAFSKFPLIAAAFGFLVYRCLFASGPAERLFSRSPLRWLGNMSYSYYLMHSLGLHAFFLVLKKTGPAFDVGPGVYVAFLPAAFAASVLASLPVYLWVERPFSLKVHGAERPNITSGAGAG